MRCDHNRTNLLSCVSVDHPATFLLANTDQLQQGKGKSFDQLQNRATEPVSVRHSPTPVPINYFFSFFFLRVSAVPVHVTQPRGESWRVGCGRIVKWSLRVWCGPDLGLIGRANQRGFKLGESYFIFFLSKETYFLYTISIGISCFI